VICEKKPAVSLRGGKVLQREKALRPETQGDRGPNIFQKTGKTCRVFASGALSEEKQDVLPRLRQSSAMKRKPGPAGTKEEGKSRGVHHLSQKKKGMMDGAGVVQTGCEREIGRKMLKEWPGSRSKKKREAEGSVLLDHRG